MKWLQSWVMTEKNILMRTILFSVLVGLAIIIQSYMIVKIVDEVFLKNSEFSHLYNAFLLLLGAILLRVIATTLNSQMGVKLAFSIKRKVRFALLEKWREDSLQTSIKGQAGSKVTMLVELVDELESYYREYVPQVIKSTVIPFLLLIAVFSTHVYSGLILLFTAPLIPVSYIIVGLQTKRKSEEQLKKLSLFSGKFLDLLQGLPTLKLFNQGKKQREALRASNETYQKSTMEILKVAFASTFFTELVVTLGIGLVALEIGFQMITFNNMSFLQAFFILALTPEFYNAVKDLAGAFHTGRGSMAAAEIIEKELTKEVRNVQWGKHAMAEKPMIELKNGSFSYGEQFHMENLNISIPFGSRVAIVGPTGQGKTTLLNILAGVYELEKGEIYLDQELRKDKDEDDWFAKIAYISQNPYLFSGTIAQNITMKKNVENTKHDVAIALEKAKLGDWAAQLKEGFDTPIGEAGRGVSGGEKQRIAIARAFYKNPKIVFFDEPTMGLDLQTEELIQQSMDELAATSTMITVAHRLHTISKAEQIIVVNEGAITGMGTHEQLLETNDIYRQMIGGELVEKSH